MILQDRNWANKLACIIYEKGDTYIQCFSSKQWKNKYNRGEFYGNNGLSILIMRIKRE